MFVYIVVPSEIIKSATLSSLRQLVQSLKYLAAFVWKTGRFQYFCGTQDWLSQNMKNITDLHFMIFKDKTNKTLTQIKYCEKMGTNGYPKAHGGRVFYPKPYGTKLRLGKSYWEEYSLQAIQNTMDHKSTVHLTVSRFASLNHFETA